VYLAYNKDWTVLLKASDSSPQIPPDLRLEDGFVDAKTHRLDIHIVLNALTLDRIGDGGLCKGLVILTDVI
jgi:hypothetical protein